MAARKAAVAHATTGHADPSKMATMIRPGELACFDEEQRKLIFEMVKDGTVTEAQAFAEVKRAQPRTFSLKYLGAVACAAKTLRSTLTAELGELAIVTALERLKKTKPESHKVNVTFSTVNFRIVDDKTEDVMENEPIGQIAYCAVLTQDKKRVAYVSSYSRLGLVWVHLFVCKNAKEATEVWETMTSRKHSALEAKSLLPSNGLHALADDGGDDAEDEDSSAGAPLGVFHVSYLGHTAVSAAEGEVPIEEALNGLKDTIALSRKLKSKKGPGVGQQVILVISSEGVRTVERHSRDVLHNVIIKAVSYSTEVTGNKVDLFAFIELDDRRNAKTCHLFLCECHQKGAAAAICDALYKAYAEAVAEAKRRAGNPFHPMGRARDQVQGPLADLQISRKELTAIKAIGAGQFGKVFLAESLDQSQRAVKMLRNGASQEDRTEFLREAQTMLDLGTHKNLVRFIGVSVAQRPWLVVLEFCQYGDLSDVLKACAQKSISLRLAERLLWCQQMADGLAFITSKKFVHMDLAARNCLLHTNNLLKVADFGLTRKYDAGQQHYRQVGVMKLSIRWLAIDSFDHKIFSEKSDVWSYGVTLWEIFNGGSQPYKGMGLTDVLKLVRKGYRLDMPQECPPDVWALIASCWESDRTRRPTFVALRESLHYIQAQNPGRCRDIGSLLSGDLAKKLNRLSVRVRSKNTNVANAAAAPGVPPPAEVARPATPDMDGDLVGAVDEDEVPHATANPQSMALPRTADTPIDQEDDDDDAGDDAGDRAADRAADRADDDAGDDAGDRAGDRAGDDAGDGAGDDAGDRAGDGSDAVTEGADAADSSVAGEEEKNRGLDEP